MSDVQTTQILKDKIGGWYLFGIWCLVLGFLVSFSLNSQTTQSGVPNQTRTEYQVVRGVIHLQTPVSGGARQVSDYLKLARQNNIGILIITDHDNLSYEYAVHPLRWLVKKRVEQNAVLTYGIPQYLELLKPSGPTVSDVIIIDGLETAPFYYWTGSVHPSRRLSPRIPQTGLTLSNRGKHILVIGLGNAETYENLPTISDDRSSFDAYHGPQGEKPYQELIDYVNHHNGVTFWAHPEAKEKWEGGGVAVQTPPYPESLLNTFNYTGFSVLSEGYQIAGRIGGIWDTVLKEYCQGKRQKPVWAIGELDDYGTKMIDSIQTVFMLTEKSYLAAIQSLKSGRVYVLFKPDNHPALNLERFSIMDSGQPAIIASSGGEIICQKQPTLNIRLTAELPIKVTVKLVRAGKLLKEFNDTTPLDITFEDTNITPNEKTYYRLDITNEFGGKIISNPIFVTAK